MISTANYSILVSEVQVFAVYNNEMSLSFLSWLKSLHPLQVARTPSISEASLP